MRINKSKSYIVPLLDEFVKIRFVKLIHNSYLFLEGKDKEYIIIQYDQSKTLEEYLEELRNSKYLVDIVYQEDYVYVIFDVPEKLKYDYKCFLDGKFSYINKKDKIINFLKSNYGAVHFNAIDRIHKVLYKDKALKEEIEFDLDIPIPPDSELSSIPSKQQETLKL